MVTHAFSPKMLYPSVSFSARVVSSLGWAPTRGSEIATDARCGSQAARCSAVPKPSMKKRATICWPAPTFPEQAGALDNGGFLACNRGI